MKTLKITCVILIAFFLAAYTFREIPAGYKAGDKATSFKLKNINDKEVSLTDYKDVKGFIIIFTCNHCPFSVAYEDRIVALDKKYSVKGYPVIAINPNDDNAYPDDSFENMKKRAKEKNFTFPYLRDDSQETARTYGAARTPHVYILNKTDDNLIVKYVGAIDDNTENSSEVKEKYVENAIDQLLNREEVKVPLTKAIGCGIKWKK